MVMMVLIGDDLDEDDSKNVLLRLTKIDKSSKTQYKVIIKMEIKWSPMTMIVMLLMMMDKQRNQAQFCCSNCNGVGEPSFKQALL